MNASKSLPRLASLVASLGALFVARDAHAFAHVVKEGENLSSISKDMYGASAYEVVLVAANGLDLQGGSKPVPGMRLEIPSLGTHHAEPGETWHAIAARYLGDGRRADLLARANHAVAWVPPADGQTVTLPYHLTIVAVEGETVFRLATRFYGNASRAWEINAYNGFAETHPFKRGDVVLVPLVDLPLTEAGQREERASTAPESSRDTGPLREKELTALAEEQRRAAYVEVVARGNRLLSMRGITREESARVERSLLEAYVALGAASLAARTCAAWRMLEPKAVLDPVHVSPKILRACEATK